jgi:hypothetical protein
MDCEQHDWIEITTITEEAQGLRRFMCANPGCYAEKTDPPTH